MLKSNKILPQFTASQGLISAHRDFLDFIKNCFLMSKIVSDHGPCDPY